MTEPIATTDAGRVRGVDLDGVLAFKGLRYAAPPTGARRFLAPAKVEPWDGVLDAGALGPSCPQPDQRPAGWTHETLEDEDCLRLNVWTPALDGKRRPVLVWFHGGGFTIGSGSWPVYDGAALARRGDVVTITVNHRLGPLGYLHLAGLGGDELAASGNAGMLDLLASLEWVKRNAAAFGGNPDQVMIFGESGGGAKVSALLAMPEAKGLFHRAAIQSGPGRYVLSAEQAKEQTQRFLGKLGIPVGPGAVDALRALPARALIDAQGGRDAMSTGARGFAPVLDGKVIPRHPVQALESGAAPDVPILIGTNFDEATMFLGADPVLTDPSKLRFEDLPERLRAYGERTQPLIAAYRKSRPEGTPLDILLAINTDAMMRVPSIKLAEKKLAGPGKAPVFMYLFCWAAGPLRSAHGFELAFMFDNAREPVLHSSPSRQQLAERMSEAWLAFAKSGDPSHDGLPRWRPYDTATRTTMIFDRGTCELRDDPWGEERRAWVR